MQITPYDSAETLLTPKILAKFQLGHPNGGAKYRWGTLQSAIFDQYLAISETVQDTQQKKLPWYTMVTLWSTMVLPW